MKYFLSKEIFFIFIHLNGFFEDKIQYNNYSFMPTQDKNTDETAIFNLPVDLMPLCYQSLDKHGYFLEVNQKFLEVLGYKKEEVIGKWFGDFISRNSLPNFEKNFQQYKKMGEIYHVEFEMIKKNGETIIVGFDGKIEYNKDQGFKRTHCFFKDISERKNTEKQFHETSALLESTLNAIPDVIGIQGKNHEIIRYNHAGYKFLGLTHEEVFGKKCYELVGRKQPCKICATREAYKTKKPAHVTRYEKTMQRWLDLRSYPVLDNDGEIVMVIEHFRDITEKVKSEQELNKIRVAMEQSPAAIIITSLDGIIEYINPKFVELTGYNRKEAIGKTPAILKSGKHNQKFYTELWETITSGKEWSGEFINKKKNGKLFWEKALISPIKDETGKVTHFVAIKENITDKKKLEQVHHEKKLAERSAELKQRFLANMSHEMRTPMNGIIGMTDLLNNTSLNNIQEEYVDIIKKSSENLLHLINDILDITRIEEGKLSFVHSNFNLRNTILNSFNLFYPIISQKDISLDIKIPGNYPPIIHTDETRLKQVISNLLSNAIKYTDKGSIKIDVQEIEKQGDMVVTQINVTDTGIGIKEKDKNHVFDVFSRVDDTVTRKTEGTGLGLAISREIAKLLGGDIGVESTEGKGSTFWFTFKAKISKAGAIKAIQNEMPISQNIDMNVLFAEDKKVNQKVVSLMLENANCSVTIAENGHKVLEEYKKKPFDVILMDIMMPGMDGITAMKKLKEKYSNLPPIIGLSANAMKGDKEKYLQEGLDDYITKPVNQQTLYKKLLKWKMDK